MNGSRTPTTPVNVFLVEDNPACPSKQLPVLFEPMTVLVDPRSNPEPPPRVCRGASVQARGNPRGADEIHRRGLRVPARERRGRHQCRPGRQPHRRREQQDACIVAGVACVDRCSG